jgi:hypothetical protein
MKTTLKNSFKQFLFRYAPTLASKLQIIAQRNHIRRFERSLGLPQIAAAFTNRYGFKILAGSFEGMIYLKESIGSALVPKLLGSYEAELQGILAQVIRTDYQVQKVTMQLV